MKFYKNEQPNTRAKGYCRNQMKLFIYLFSIAVATLLFVAEDYFWFGAYVVFSSVTIYFGNKKDNEYLDFN